MNVALILTPIVIVGIAMLSALAIFVKREIVAAWRRWQVSLEQARCDRASAPIVCGRTRE